ncbi:MAG TPA: ATP-binding protein [Gemmatimonadaceae bacterium]|nr:ATP-binding protein [Gemmatimonadaceae bacterium]
MASEAPLIKSVKFQNYKLLRDAFLPLGRVTLIVGPNGSGKSTALQALRYLGGADTPPVQWVLPSGRSVTEGVFPQIWFELSDFARASLLRLVWHQQQLHVTVSQRDGSANSFAQGFGTAVSFGLTLGAGFERIPVYALDANRIAEAVPLHPNVVLQESGTGLAGVLDRLRDQNPERFDALNQELGRWLPEFDRVLFETPGQGIRSLALRTRQGRHSIRAADLSQGTLLALAILTIAYDPNAPRIVGFEEPERGIHPRLLRDVQDALYRLAYPENFGEDRQPTQVVITTHSPYMLDLFRERPEEIVIAHKEGAEAKFERLVDRIDVDEILRDVSLGEAWYTGILGGVPAEK